VEKSLHPQGALITRHNIYYTTWKQGIIKAIFRTGDILRITLKFFSVKPNTPYQKLADLLNQRLREHFE